MNRDNVREPQFAVWVEGVRYALQRAPSKERSFVTTLTRRAEFLQQRIKDSGPERCANDARELAALLWAIENIARNSTETKLLDPELRASPVKAADITSGQEYVALRTYLRLSQRAATVAYMCKNCGQRNYLQMTSQTLEKCELCGRLLTRIGVVDVGGYRDGNTWLEIKDISPDNMEKLWKDLPSE